MIVKFLGLPAYMPEPSIELARRMVKAGLMTEFNGWFVPRGGGEPQAKATFVYQYQPIIADRSKASRVTKDKKYYESIQEDQHNLFND